METFELVIDFLFGSAVVITAVRMYFTINKLWKRKNDQEVCNSISIFAYSLAILVHVPYMIKFAVIENDYVPALNDAINIGAYAVIVLIGTGFWVRANRRRGFFGLIKRALRLEGKESGHLIKNLVMPSGANKIIDILQKVARLDNEVSKSEIKLIKKFADNWNIEVTDEVVEKWKSMEQTSLIDIRHSVEDYLNLSPPIKQASELLDIVSLTIKADKVVSTEEQMFLDEATGMINSYVKKEDNAQMFQVLLVPQRKKKIKAINEIFPDVELVDRRGGKVHIQGRYYSKEFAEAICEKYIDLGIFSIWEEVQPETA
ncbi:hypothetical protein ACFLSQ_07495 [Bacteroidota bacterium]